MHLDVQAKVLANRKGIHVMALTSRRAVLLLALVLSVALAAFVGQAKVDRHGGMSPRASISLNGATPSSISLNSASPDSISLN